MSTNLQLSREEIAQREIGHTAVTPAQARALAAVFLAVVFAVPAVQWAIDRGRERNLAEPGWSEVAEAYRLGALPESVASSRRSRIEEIGLLRRLKVANDQLLVNIHRLEDRQREESFLTLTLVTPFQTLATRTIGLGNEKGYPGRDGWAFFRTGIDALTGPGFLDEKQLARRAASGTEWVPAPTADPRPAILEFHHYLASRGIDLVLVPAPTKPAVHPEEFSRRYASDAGPVRNPSFAAWMEEMVAAGITVFDPAPMLVAGKAEGAQYLETDTHWTPVAMEAVAGQIAEATGLAPGDSGYRRGNQEVAASGDVAANLLKLEGTGVYPRQLVTIHPVTTAAGEPWSPRDDAAVLLMGDSFANIFSATNLNWGGGAGLAEQLSYALQREVDVIAENDAGARATRMALAKALHRGDRLAGKQVVIWEFAARELAVGNWTRIDWEAIEIPEISPTPAAGARGAPIRGKIEAISRSPRPGTVTYKDCIVQAHLVDVEGLDGVDELMLNLWGMRDNQLTDSAGYAAGEYREFRVTDWERAQTEFGLAGTMQRELDDPDFVLIDLPLYWGE